MPRGWALGTLTSNQISRRQVTPPQRRAKKAGVTTQICNHSWRATGITTFLENGGAIEMAQYMAGHADPRTTKLYDRRRQQVTSGEVERIRYEKKQQTPGGEQGKRISKTAVPQKREGSGFNNVIHLFFRLLS